MKMERAYPPKTDAQLTPPLLIGEQGIFILCDASGAKLSDEERKELETLAHEALVSHLKGAGGPIDDKVLQDAFEEANLRLLAANSNKPTPISALCVVKEEGVSSCLVASAGRCKLVRVDGDQV